MKGDEIMSSDLLTTILCPKCGKKLEVCWSRNNVGPVAHCLNCLYVGEMSDLTFVFLMQYYKQKEGIKD